MKFKVFLILALLMGANSYAKPPSDYAAGGMVGWPSGATAKFWMADMQAIDVGVGYTLNDFYMVNSDYLLHFPKLINIGDLNPYIGLGAAVLIATDTARQDGSYYTDEDSGTLSLAVRAPVGLEWNIKDWGLFVEVAPGWGFVPVSYTFIGGSAGARYYF